MSNQNKDSMNMLELGCINEINFLVLSLSDASLIVFAKHSGSKFTIDTALSKIREDDKFDVALARQENNLIAEVLSPSEDFMMSIESIKNHATYFRQIANAFDKIASDAFNVEKQ